MNYQQKQAALVKLAQIRLAINHVLRNRAMQKRAAQPTRSLTQPDGSTMNEYNNHSLWNPLNYLGNLWDYYTGKGVGRYTPTYAVSGPVTIRPPQPSPKNIKPQVQPDPISTGDLIFHPDRLDRQHLNPDRRDYNQVPTPRYPNPNPNPNP